MNRVLIAALLILIAACTKQESNIASTSANAASDTATKSPAAIAALVGAEAQRYGKAISVRDTEAIMGFYAPDAWIFPPEGAVAKTPEERRAYWAAQKLPPGVSDTVGISERIDVAQSGDLAVEYGSFFELTTDSRGASNSRPHKYVAAWKKQSDGSWKVAADMWNSGQ
jgi:ketosteroid isomerase-like protein